MLSPYFKIICNSFEPQKSEYHDLITDLYQKWLGEFGNHKYKQPIPFQKKVINTSLIFLEYCKPENPRLLTPLTQSYYNEYEFPFYMSLESVKQSLDFLEYLNVIEVVKGNRKLTTSGNENKKAEKEGGIFKKFGFMTTVNYRPKENWLLDVSHDEQDIAFANLPFTEQDFRNKISITEKQTKLPIAFIKYDKDTDKESYRLAPLKEQQKLNSINWDSRRLPGFNRRPIFYKQIFLESTNYLGRYYSSWQFLKKTRRKRIIENGFVEHDFQASVPNILHIGLTGKKFDGDIYKAAADSLGMDDKYFAWQGRDLLKHALIIALNSDTPKKYNGAMRDYLKKKNFKRWGSFNQTHLLKAIKENIPIFESLLNTTTNLGSFLFRIEADITYEVSRQCSELEIPLYILHDAFYTKSEYSSQLWEIMDTTLLKVVSNHMSKFYGFLGRAFKIKLKLKLTSFLLPCFSFSLVSFFLKLYSIPEILNNDKYKLEPEEVNTS